MHILQKITQNKQVFKLLASSWNRNLHSKRPVKRNLYVILTGLGLSSFYYYLYLVPKWSNQHALVDLTNYTTQDHNVLDEDSINVALESNLSTDNPTNAKEQFNFIDKVVKKSAPGVFHIYITNAKANSKSDNAGSSPFVYGSGFVIRKDGWALTNAHVVLNKDSYITCKMSDGAIYNAEIVDMDVNIDVALLKLETTEDLTPLPLEKPGIVNVGEWVVALGSPLCLSNSISVGVVSSINRSAKELGLKNYSMSYIQTDALITFGNSGGPLVNLNGKVIGISSLRLTSGISFAIPIEYCLKFLKNCKEFSPNNASVDIKTDNDQMFIMFGLTTISINPDLLIDVMQKQLMNVPKSVYEGLLIWKVLENGLAKQSGLAAGDIITHMNGVPVKHPQDLYPKGITGDFVKLVVIKKATQEEVTISIPLKNLLIPQSY